jgi:hypothetical protein
MHRRDPWLRRRRAPRVVDERDGYGYLNKKGRAG